MKRYFLTLVITLFIAGSEDCPFNPFPKKQDNPCGSFVCCEYQLSNGPKHKCESVQTCKHNKDKPVEVDGKQAIGLGPVDGIFCK